MPVFPRSSPARRVLPHPGGRAGRARRPVAYDELNDHLGNARVVFHRPASTTVTRRLELSEPQNNTAFTDENTYRTATVSAHSPDYVARLDGRTAPAPMTRTIPLLQGDTVTFSAWSLIRPDFSSRAAPGPVKRLLARLRPLLLLGAATPPAQLIAEGPQPGTTTTATRWWGRAAAGVGLTLGGGPPPASLRGTTSLSQAWVKYRLVYEDGTVDEHTEYVPLDPTWQTTRVAVRARQGGTLTLSVGTSETSGATYFDDLTVEQTGGMIVQEQHQYAYGSPLVGLNYAVGNKRYRYGYQGQYAEKDAETGFESFELRLYNSRIGRWTSYDPDEVHNSPYLAMANNPISVVDVDGGIPGGTVLQRAVASIGLGSVSSNGFRFGFSAGWSAVGSAIGEAAKSSAPFLMQAGVSSGMTAMRANVLRSPTQGPNTSAMFSIESDAYSRMLNLQTREKKEISGGLVIGPKGEKRVVVFGYGDNSQTSAYFKPTNDESPEAYRMPKFILNYHGVHYKLVGFIHTHPWGDSDGYEGPSGVTSGYVNSAGGTEYHDLIAFNKQGRLPFFVIGPTQVSKLNPNKPFFMDSGLNRHQIMTTRELLSGKSLFNYLK